MTITDADVWEVVKQDSEFMAKGFQSKEAEDVFKDYLENSLMTAIGDMLDKPVTIANMIDTKVAYIKNVLESGLLSRMVDAMPEDMLGLFGASGMLETLEDVLAQAIEMLEPIAKDVPMFLKEKGVSEEDVYEFMKFSPDNITKAMGGKFTIGDVLISQPAIILRMDDND